MNTENDCVICSNFKYKYISTLEPFIKNIKDYEYGVNEERALYRCVKCDLISIRPAFVSENLHRLYPEKYSSYTNKGSSRSFFSFAKKFINRLEAKKVSSYIPKNGVLIEVGCGNGLFLEEIRAIRSDIKLIGFDIAKTDAINKEFIEFYPCEFESFNGVIMSCDLIYFSNLIEHVINPKIFLDKCREVLNDGGVILGITPTHDSIDRKIFKRFWGGYHFPRHLNIFNKKNISILLSISGFQVSKIKGSYGFWYVSFANILLKENGYKKRGLLFLIVNIIFFPLDFVINLYRVTGSMTFIARKI